MVKATVFDALGETLFSFEYKPADLRSANSSVIIPNVKLPGKEYELLFCTMPKCCFIRFGAEEIIRLVTGMCDGSFPISEAGSAGVVNLDLTVSNVSPIRTFDEVPMSIRKGAMCGWSPISNAPKYKCESDNKPVILDNGVRVGEGIWCPYGGFESEGAWRWIDEHNNEHSQDMNPQPLYYQSMPPSFKDRHRHRSR